ncbi:MAG: hypothetical protein EBU73_00565 [Chitinophagia bacterium]|nr:hypothetical protein [Chitinophagia bacterium]
MFKSLFQKNKLYIIGTVIGAISGFAYWKFIGCQSGTCKITSSPLNSTIYFAILGALIFSLFKKEK